MKTTRSIASLLLGISLMAAEYHVTTTGDNANAGTPDKPLKTISAAAQKALPGDIVTVHAGIYRERVDPPRGGESDAKRIIYQAAPGEPVEIRGSEVVTGWYKVDGDVWKIVIPNSFFGKFNPFNDLINGNWLRDNNRQHHTGTVYLNGKWLLY